MKAHCLLVGGLVLVAAGCSSGGDLPPFRHGEFYRELAAAAEQFLFVAGDWKEDFDDGAFYGPAFYAWAGTSTGNQAWLDRAAEAYADNRQVVAGASDLLAADMNDLAMSLLGMLEYVAATGRRDDLALIDDTIGRIAELVAQLGHYLPPYLVPGYAMETYGPTSINGLLALIALQRAHVVAGGDTAAFVEFARQVAGRIEQEAWDGESYAFGPERPGLFLYPNVTMIIVNARLYQLTGTESFRERALAVYRALEPLRVGAAAGLAAPGRYRSPYSAETMGAQTDDYSTLSAQNYLMLAQMLLYQITGEAAYLEQMDPVLDFIAELLPGQACLSDIHLAECQPACPADQACLKSECFTDSCHDGVLHHWMDGRVARPEDPEFFCSGCNLQLLYLMWYRQEGLKLDFPR